MKTRNKHSKSRKAGAYKANRATENAHKSANTQKSAEQNGQAQVQDETPEEKIVRRAYEIAPEWKISIIAKRRFMNLPAAFQNSKGKEACIKEALASHKDLIPDPTRYWIWLIDETRKLVRVWDFEETCTKLGLTPLTVAQHLILEGKSVCNAIRLEGLEAYGSNVRMFVDPLFEDEFHLFGKKETPTEVKKEGGDE